MLTFKDNHAPSIGAKLALALFTLVGVIAATIRLVNGSSVFHNWMLLSCTLIFYFRLVLSLFVFIKRKVSWVEGIVVGILYGIMVAGFSSWGTKISSPVVFWDVTGLALFGFGSYINSFSDYQRHVWKMQVENHGHLYTRGLFRHAMHINYFGDSIMFIGFATVTQNAMSFIPVIVIILNLIFLQIPQLDAHLKNKYRTDFLEYRRKTKKFIPFIY